ncbi:sulfurtransferase [Oleiphilus sp. HI0081]|jgi:rhodanese-related sulfurtransferase|uniref:rhodanese-like domain-containing protein n=2 Tax=Oleiphilus TaxID=141450 RepID=UPI0007C29A71|nr:MULTISPECIES: rhodanese-like domain-containing protein [unclassified Oleiphilus]KZY45685.1 sulfurtransferase [Oleiphilus sp. HI0050]KZY80740.1 sulfurtransferase [Oleiphilus sp. HI0069]KZY88376.1 sulfurtransferase [Oleiphilus sp. HI0072]KZZ21782.1 sulfurtransferase [Oleiphilus sp. HI0081]KZZ32960.1 sulfurtransferase [Oleiphilus sp. HI0085]
MDRLFEFIGNHIELSGLFVALLAALWFTERSRSGRAVSPQEATLLLNKDQAVIVDLRDKKDFSEGKITGALHIPFANLKERSTELEKYKDKQIILVDKMGQHSGMAGKTLQAEGFENVCRMSGGIAEWKNSNMPLVRK